MTITCYVHEIVDIFVISRAAEFVGLTVHQLMNDNTAVALNYGVFWHQEFNVTSQVCAYMRTCSAIHTYMHACL